MHLGEESVRQRILLDGMDPLKSRILDTNNFSSTLPVTTSPPPTIIFILFDLIIKVHNVSNKFYQLNIETFVETPGRTRRKGVSGFKLYVFILLIRCSVWMDRFIQNAHFYANVNSNRVTSLSQIYTKHVILNGPHVATCSITLVNRE